MGEKLEEKKEKNEANKEELFIEQEKKRVSQEIVDELYALRKAKGLTQQMLSELTGIKRPNIARVEANKYTPTIDVLVRIADSMGKKLEIKLVDKE